jgi:hypothetical protein
LKPKAKVFMLLPAVKRVIIMNQDENHSLPVPWRQVVTSLVTLFTATPVFGGTGFFVGERQCHQK